MKRPIPNRRGRTLAVDRNEARRIANRRLVRTIVLGTIATIAAVIWLGDQYGIEREVMLEFVGLAFAFVALLAVAGVGGAVVLALVKRLYSRSRKNRSERGR